MKIRILKNRLWLLAIYILIGFLFANAGINISNQYNLNYQVLLFTYVVVVGFSSIMASSENVDVFDPFTIISILYIGIMIIYPLYDYTRMFLTKAGVDTSSGAIKGTLIFLLSYASFCLGYFSKKIEYTHKKTKFFIVIDSLSDSTLSTIAIIWWLFSFAGVIIAQLSRGYSLLYLFSLGSSTSQDMEITTRSGLLFLLMLGPTLIISLMMIYVYSKSILLKIAFTLLTYLYLFMGNGRWLVLIAIMAPVVYRFTKKRRNPRLRIILLFGVLLLITLSIMQVNRVSIVSGEDFRDSFRENVFSIETYLAPFESDFSTYKTYYAIVKAIPEKKGYLYGKGMVGYTLALVLPRVLWEGKPDAPEREVVAAALNQTAVLNGEAYPNVGIFYSEFGIIGCVLLMYLFGILMSKARKLYRMESKTANIVYAFLWPFCFQLVTRSFSHAVYVVLFSLLPLWTAYFVATSQKRRLLLKW